MTADPFQMRQFRRASWFIGVFNAIFLAYLIVKPFRGQLFVALDDLLQISGGLFAAALCFIGCRRSDFRFSGWREAPRAEFTALFCCLGMASYGIGQMLWAYAELVLHDTTQFPAASDVAYLASYPLLLLGILASPSRPAPVTTRARILLDGLIVMTAAVAFSWYFLLGPTLAQGSVSALGKVVATAYPLGDLLLIFCVLLFGARAGDTQQRTLVRIIWLGMLVVVATDSIAGYRALHNMVATGAITDVGWSLGYMPVGLAIGCSRLLAKKRLNDTPPPVEIRSSADTGLWQALTPYALLPCVGILVLYAQLNYKDQQYADGVYLGAVALTGLVLVRQVLAILENRELNDRLKDAQDELKSNVDALLVANERLQSLATTDLLTDLLNHRGLVAALDAELERSLRYERSCAILFVDIDHFKSLNDSCGHPAGDAALREFAGLIRENLRTVDILGRWGGEEFLALLPETNGAEARIAAEHLRAAVSEHKFSAAGGVQLTCSVGTASYPADASDRDLLVDAADRAMYVAKRLGRNQVRDARDPAVVAVMSTSLGRDSREETAMIGTVEALSMLVEVRDRYTGEHTHEVEALATRLAVHLGMSRDEARMVGLAGRLHDIGKVAIPDAVLLKPERLTASEWEIIRTHTSVAADVIGRVPALRALVPVIRGHHERWDGTGYPDKLADERIPLGARIIAVADAYCAMTTDRPYRSRCRPVDALSEIERCSGTQFDPDVVAALLSVIRDEQARADRQTILKAA